MRPTKWFNMFARILQPSYGTFTLNVGGWVIPAGPPSHCLTYWYHWWPKIMIGTTLNNLKPCNTIQDPSKKPDKYKRIQRNANEHKNMPNKHSSTRIVGSAPTLYRDDFWIPVESHLRSNFQRHCTVWCGRRHLLRHHRVWWSRNPCHPWTSSRHQCPYDQGDKNTNYTLINPKDPNDRQENTTRLVTTPTL